MDFKFKILLSPCRIPYHPKFSQQRQSIRGVIDMGHIDISITLLKQYSLLLLVNTYRNLSKYQKHENGLTLREEIES